MEWLFRPVVKEFPLGWQIFLDYQEMLECSQVEKSAEDINSVFEKSTTAN